MGILNRLNTLVRASLGDITDRVSDPGVKITILLHEMDSNLKAARREIRDMLAMEKRLDAELAKSKAKAAQWKELASKAVKLGDDDLARQCLYRRFETEKSSEDLSLEIEEGRTHIRSLLKASKRLEARIKTLRIREKSLKQSAGTRGMKKAFDRFQKMEDSVESESAERELDAELDPAARALEEEILKQKLADMENAAKAEDELFEIKARISDQTETPGSAAKKELNKPGSETDPGWSGQNADLQKELDAIRKQLQDEWESENSLDDLEQ